MSDGKSEPIRPAPAADRRELGHRGTATGRGLVASVYVQVIGIGGFILVDRLQINPVLGTLVLVALAVGGWLALAGPAARRAITQWWRS